MRAEDILKKRRDRTIAIILSMKEREIDPLLSGADGRRASDLFRKVVLDQVNDFYDMARDVAASGEAEGFEFNAAVWGPRIEGRLNDLQDAVAALSNGHA